MSNPQLLSAIRAAVAGQYDVLGEMGEGEEGRMRERDSVSFFLAREGSSGELVSLKAERTAVSSGAPTEYTLTVIRELDSSVPDASACPACRKPLRRWARFCGQCGLDVSGVGPSITGQRRSRPALLEAVRVAASRDYEVLGEMPRKEGGGLVYFAREAASGRIVSLRLQQEGSDAYSVAVTRVLQPLSSISADATQPLPGRPAPVTADAAITIISGKGDMPGFPATEQEKDTRPRPGAIR